MIGSVILFNRPVHESNGLCDAPVRVVPLPRPGGGSGRSHDDVTDGRDGPAAGRGDGAPSERRDGSSGRHGTAQRGHVITLRGGRAPEHDGTAAEQNDGAAASTLSSSGVRSPTGPTDAVEHFPGVCVCVTYRVPNLHSTSKVRTFLGSEDWSGQ